MIFRLEAFACEMWLLLERAAVQYVPRLCLLTQLHVPQTPHKAYPDQSCDGLHRVGTQYAGTGRFAHWLHPTLTMQQN